MEDARGVLMDEEEVDLLNDETFGDGALGKAKDVD